MSSRVVSKIMSHIVHMHAAPGGFTPFTCDDCGEKAITFDAEFPLPYTPENGEQEARILNRKCAFHADIHDLECTGAGHERP
jgi:hypothetical protein